ncbi:hypothetical protein AALP_AA7G161900 [Arabis alpina]|uniref:DUF1985 domain-containing protein n=1 Tax=Arabis alpina TaxID=50452 RepID=A0A087GIF6_ARAAL|nr:hypothetical protein AALP_AA7G161900 [Arabis alpina]
MSEAVGDDVYNDIMNNSSVGIILKLATRKFNFSGATVTHFQTNQLKTGRFYEMWSLFGGRPVRFSLNEFEEARDSRIPLKAAKRVMDPEAFERGKIWEEKRRTCSSAKVEESEDEDEDDSPVEKKKKIKESKKIKAKVVVEESEDEDDSPVEKKEKKKEKVKHGKRKIRSDTSGDEDSEEECDLDIPIKNIPKLKKKKETEAGGIGEVLKLLQGMVGTIANFDTRFTSLEGKGNASKAVVDEQSNTGVGGDASMEEDDLSWMEQQPTSKTKFPVNRVVRKPDVKAKPTEQRNGKSFSMSKRIASKEKEPTAAKMKEGAECVEIHDLTKDAIADAGKRKERSDSDFVTPPRPRKAMHYAYSSSSSDDDDVKAKQINDALDNALGVIAKLPGTDDLVVPP